MRHLLACPTAGASVKDANDVGATAACSLADVSSLAVETALRSVEPLVNQGHSRP
jgi:hypothetical protein